MQRWEYDEKKVASLIAKMPMSKWSGSSKGLISFEDGILDVQLEIPDPLEKNVYEFTRDVSIGCMHIFRGKRIAWRLFIRFRCSEFKPYVILLYN
jgi:hypothetical protein